MAKYSENKISSKNIDWGRDPSNGLPFCGNSVQDYIKEQFDAKAGCFYYDASNNRFLVFSDEENRDLYLDDSVEYASLLIGTFDAPFNYTASIRLINTDSVNYIQYGSTGNYIQAEFDVVNKSGASIGENVNVTVTFRNGSATSKLVRSVAYGSKLSLNIDEFLAVGTNVITISAVGQNTLAATSIGLTYYSINLQLSDSFDISQHVNPTRNLNISFNIVGNGIKRLEWFIDGTKVPYDSQNDDVTASEASRTKTIALAPYTLSNGRHNLQYRAYVETGDGTLFYSNTLFRDFIVDNGYLQDYVVVAAFEFPYSDTYGNNGIIDPITEPIPIYGATQYISKDIYYAIYSPFGESEMLITLGQNSSTHTVANWNVYDYLLRSFTSGTTYFSLALGSTILEFNVHFDRTKYTDLEEIENGLIFALDKSDSTNTSDNRDSWSYGPYSATMTGFSWTDRSGWTSDGLLIPGGTSFVTNFAPLNGNIVSTGFTLELEFETLRVLDDSTVICDLRTNGTGLLITASEASFTSRGGVSVSTKYKSGVPLRISFVVNSPQAVRNKNLLFIYIDGILAGAMNYPSSDSFTSSSFLQFIGANTASILVKQVRCYNRALSSNEILNNYILYRSTTEDLVSCYDRNNILDDNSQPSYEKLAAYTPIIIITGDVEKLMNFDRSNKSTYVKMDKIEIINNFDPTKNLTIYDASMRCQGTSSMDYPRKNFRFYLKKDSADTTVENYVTKVFDYQGNELTGGNRKYAFKDGAQEVSCWCLKADYAESSSTHNTGIARLWNTVMKNAVVNNIDSRHYVLEHYENSKTPCRTLAQHAALEHNFDKDVRTTVDGFPIVLFYHKNESDALICLGKYNWNNDKSTESVYGFVDIPGFDNQYMECWEVVNGDYPINQFTDISLWNAGKNNGGWQDSFEARYPDDNGEPSEQIRAQGALKNVSIWINSTNGASVIVDNKIVVGDQTLMNKFKTEKWYHLDIYKLAAYYVYLMRFGGVDQTVKNAMFTTEDGQHWFYINYDNDTILGVRNDGLLKFDYTIDRQSKDPDNASSYCYAGHDSVLWNNLEADDEFMEIVKVVDQALFNAGLNYVNVINMFNNEQSGKWSERLHNYDYTFKYLDVWLDDQNMQLEKLQGPRRTHREWWLSNRFAIYDAKNMTGQYLKSYVSIKPATDGATVEGDIVQVTPQVNDQVFGWRLGTNGAIHSENGTINTPIDFDLYDAGISYYIGGSLFFFNAVYMKKIDFSAISSHIQELSFNDVNSDVFPSYLEDVVVGDTNSAVNTTMSNIGNIGNVKYLKNFQMCNCTGVSNLDLSNNIYLENLDLRGSTGLTSVNVPIAAPLTTMLLPSSIQSLQMRDLLDLNTLTIDTNGSNLIDIRAINCKPFTQDITWLKSWMTGKSDEYLADCTVYLEGIDWKNIEVSDLLSFAKIGNLTLKGKIQTNIVDPETQVAQIQEVYGTHCFDSTNDLWIYNEAVYTTFTGPRTIVEGEIAQYSFIVLGKEGTITYTLLGNNRTGVTLNQFTGQLITTITNEPDSTLQIRAAFRPADLTDQDYIYETILINVKKETYPSQSDVTISGTVTWYDSQPKTYSAIIANPESFTGINHISYHWSVIGDMANYVTVASQSSNELVCTIACYEPYILTTGEVKLDFINSLGTIVMSKTYAIDAQNGDIAVARTTNPQLMNVFWNAFGPDGTRTPNKLSHADYITKDEASLFVTNDFCDGSSASASLFYNSNITHFEELEYFSSLTDIKQYTFTTCNSLRGDIRLPNSVTRFCKDGFSYKDTSHGPRFTNFYGENVLEIYKGSTNSMPFDVKYLYLPNCTRIDLGVGGLPNNVVVYAPKCTYWYSGTYYGGNPTYNVTWAVAHDAGEYTGNTTFNVTLTKYGNYDFIVYGPRGYSNWWGSSLGTINIEEDVEGLEVIDGCLYDTVNHKLLAISKNVTSVNIPSGITTIENYACYYRPNLESITIPESVTKIGAYAFRNCTALNSITSSALLETIGERAFHNCQLLSSFTFPSTLTSIGTGAFAITGLTNILIPDVNCNMPQYCFDACTSLVTAQVGTKRHSGGCFRDCNALESVIFTSATYMDGHLFDGCSSMTYLYIPSTVTAFIAGWNPTTGLMRTIGPYGGGYNMEYSYTTVIGYAYTFAFDNVKEITIPSTATSLANYLTHGKCRKVEKIYCYAMTAPTTYDYTFTNIGQDTKDSGTNELHVPVGATGYTSGGWATLINSRGFTLIEDL